MYVCRAYLEERAGLVLWDSKVEVGVRGEIQAIFFAVVNSGAWNCLGVLCVVGWVDCSWVAALIFGFVFVDVCVCACSVVDNGYGGEY